MQRRASRADTEGLIDARVLGSFQKDFMVPWRSAREIVGRPTSVSQLPTSESGVQMCPRPPAPAFSLSHSFSPFRSPAHLSAKPNTLDEAERFADKVGLSSRRELVRSGWFCHCLLPQHSLPSSVVFLLLLLSRSWDATEVLKLFGKEKGEGGRAERELKVTRR